jgi:hypothetical protein
VSPPLTKEERTELEAFKSDIVHEVHTMNEAVKVHVEKVIAPFTQVPKRIEEIETHNKKVQTPLLEELTREAKKSKAARIASTKERVKRSGADAEKLAQDKRWQRLRKQITWAVATILVAGEAYRVFFPAKDASESSKPHTSIEEPKK